MQNIFDPGYTIVEGKLLCPGCFSDISPETVLRHSSISWPCQQWIYCLCPRCNTHFHVEVLPNKIRTGLLDGAPGPCFFCCSELPVAGLAVEKRTDMLLCTYQNHQYQFFAQKG